MTELIMRFAEPVSDIRGVFHPRVMGSQRQDGSWEGWIEFVSLESEPAADYVTDAETHQRERGQLERWASGLTQVYAEGALARARPALAAPAVDSLLALQEMVEALDRRVPHVERAGELRIAADAKRLRASAIERMAFLRAGG